VPTLDTWILLAIALLNAFTAWTVIKGRGVIKLLEQNTNSIKDALVLATAIAARAEGKAEGIAEEKKDPSP